MPTLVVIPAYNESASVAEVVRRVHEVGLPALVVDDGSIDGTAAVARSAGAAVARLPVNLGVGGALRTGFRYAVDHGYDRVVQVDGDGQHDPDRIASLLEVADQGAHLVVGSRFSDGDYAVSRSRRGAMRLLSWFVRRLTGLRLDDVTSGFRVISEPLLSHFAIDYPAEYLGDTVEAIVMAHRSGASIRQVPVVMSVRAAGRATPKAHAVGHVARVLLALMVKRTRVPL